MTTLEFLAQHYPLHVQRIVECMHEQGHYKDINRALAQTPAAWPCLITLISWGDTPEGVYYWRSLARAEEANAQA